ncbi:MAG: hypothetical protein NT162_01635, partial [Candidatus Woesebacteria bacterium]|nr:hypothetical protein [Candidatus Woesebacteria bacterium]
NALSKLKSQIGSLKSQTGRTTLSKEKDKQIDDYRNQFMEAVNDDLNTSKALAVLWEMLKSNIPSGDKYDLAMSFDEVLGLGLKEFQLEKVLQVSPEAKDLMEKREQLRKEGKYEDADKIRDQIQSLGFSFSDKPLN